MKKLKPNFAVNVQNRQKVIIYDMESDTEILLNEQASLIFLNGEKTIKEIADMFREEYSIPSETALMDDIQKMQTYFAETIYE